MSRTLKRSYSYDGLPIRWGVLVRANLKRKGDLGWENYFFWTLWKYCLCHPLFMPIKHIELNWVRIHCAVAAAPAYSIKIRNLGMDPAAQCAILISSACCLTLALTLYWFQRESVRIIPLAQRLLLQAIPGKPPYESPSETDSSINY